MTASQYYPTNSGYGAYRGADRDRTNGGWLVWESDPNDDWIYDARTMGFRAADLVRNDPVMAALLMAWIIGQFGSEGLKFRSLYKEDDSLAVTDHEKAVRKQMEAYVTSASCGTQLDAGGMLTRHEMEEALAKLAAIYGEGFLVRCFIPDRPGCSIATCWRLIRPERVANPPGQQDNDLLYQGFILDANGAPAGIWIGPPFRAGKTYKAEEWTRVDWYAADGSRNVVHRIGDRPPGGIRAVTMYSNNIVMARQIKGLLDAQVVAKRIQACHPMFISCDDPVAAAAADRNGAVWGPNTTLEPGKIYYISRDSTLSFPSWQFQGADMREFLDTLYRNQFAAWGMPIDVVLAQLGKTNMAASRSAWLQYYRQCARAQDDNIEQVSRILDESIVREGVARGLIDTRLTDWQKIMVGRYVRPPRSMPDPLKEAMAVKAWSELGRDLTSLFAESAGADFRDSIAQRAQDDADLEEHGVTLGPVVPPAPAPAPNEDDPAKGDDPNADETQEIPPVEAPTDA